MWDKILGAIGFIWGGAILVSAFFGGGSAGGFARTVNLVEHLAPGLMAQ